MTQHERRIIRIIGRMTDRERRTVTDLIDLVSSPEARQKLFMNINFKKNGEGIDKGRVY